MTADQQTMLTLAFFNKTVYTAITNNNAAALPPYQLKILRRKCVIAI